ncbi:hypothetical protein G6731_08545 [Polynucleobacter paneuropaeus]|uniref:Uncharacterized protein n=1 Tax=Polynucleobacter paneuropaeus TaxID=2527775 RepID=A0A9Q2WK63_9BURK|nr:hypothetical protein [Polynucleobacter paneuropaeus]
MARAKAAKLRYFDPIIIKLLYAVIGRFTVCEDIFEKYSPVAILLSHRVGICGATLAEVSEKNHIDIYSFNGLNFGTLIKTKRRKVYEFRATLEKIQPLLDLNEKKFNWLFDQVTKNMLKGDFNPDSILAFQKDIVSTRHQFASDLQIDENKKNIFVMLHAFTDFPHSHFNGMIFKDFGDWYEKTLQIAIKNHGVNWIFKEHPSSKYYPVRDFDFEDIRKKFKRDNIAFIGADDNFNSMSICYVGDAVITCLGSAGFEYSALAGIPSITASDNSYAEVGFAIQPSSEADYFAILDGLDSIEPLDAYKVKLAKAAYIYLHRLSKVQMTALPNLSHEGVRKFQFDKEYFSYIDNILSENKAAIESETTKYSKMIALLDFSQLETSLNEGLAAEVDD